MLRQIETLLFAPIGVMDFTSKPNDPLIFPQTLYVSAKTKL